MEMKFTKDKIEFEKELNSLDMFVIDFTKVLNSLNIKYVIVSGYVAILFGRNRASEDIDLIIENISQKKFKKLWDKLNNDFECVNTNDIKDAYDSYFTNINQIRFSRKTSPIPNVEVKHSKDETDDWTLTNRKEMILNNCKFYISPLEMQIAYKLFLGSEKDIEDARFLFKLFKDKIDMDLLDKFNRKFNIDNNLKKYIYGSA